LEFNASHASDLYAELADIVVPDAVSGSNEAKTVAMISALRQLIDDVKLPASLREVKVAENDLEMLARDAMLQQRLLINNPRDVNFEDALAIYKAAY
jgi:alcohol dehydrogenase class IV